jgi:hypothetical protein
MMRESTIRARRSHDGLLIVLGSLASLGPVSVGLAFLTAHGDIGARTMLAQLSMFAGITQGATLLAAVLRLAGRDRHVAVRRAAEGLALALPFSLLAQIGIVLCELALVAPGHHASIVGPIVASMAVTGIGSAYLASSLSAEVGAAMDRGETDGPLARYLAGLWPRGARHAPILAYLYLAVFTFCAPYLAHRAIAPLGATPVGSWLRGPYLAANDVVIALAAVLLTARLTREGDPFVQPLGDRDAQRGSRVLASSTLVLGIVLLSQLCALVPSVHLPDFGILPTGLAWRGWIGLALFGLAIAHLVPAGVLLAPSSQSPHSMLTAVCSTMIIGAWAERAALLTPLRASGFGVVDLFVSIAGMAGAAIAILLAESVIVMDAESADGSRRSQSTAAS